MSKSLEDLEKKPTVDARAKIWMSMMNGLSQDDATTLASQFDLSGGEIENIVRKHSVTAILADKQYLTSESFCVNTS